MKETTIKMLRDKVNDTYTEDAYQEYTFKRKQLASEITENSKDGIHINIERKTLSLLCKTDFPKGSIIYVGNYVIFIDDLNTMVAHIDRIFSSLREDQVPQYIHEFVF
jgi:hypothetical protein